MAVLVSACLLGINCKYNGENNVCKKVFDISGVIPVCPEQLGGLATPRLPSEILHGDGHDVLNGSARVFNTAGEDVTNNFIRGAQLTLMIARLTGAEKAVLKARSPSCGSGVICNGTFSGKTCPGDGTAAAILKQNGIDVLSEEDLT